MEAPSGPILLDNCAISACEEVGGWRAVAGRYQLETVEEVAVEAATGFQRRRIIDPRRFREQVKVHVVSRAERLRCETDYAGLASLDDGERDLWVHALGRQDAWVLCGPDIASIKFGVEAGYGSRLVSLEELLDRIGFKPRQKLKEHHKRAWLAQKIAEFSLELKWSEVGRRAG